MRSSTSRDIPLALPVDAHPAAETALKERPARGSRRRPQTTGTVREADAGALSARRAPPFPRPGGACPLSDTDDDAQSR